MIAGKTKTQWRILAQETEQASERWYAGQTLKAEVLVDAAA